MIFLVACWEYTLLNIILKICLVNEKGTHLRVFLDKTLTRWKLNQLFNSEMLEYELTGKYINIWLVSMYDIETWTPISILDGFVIMWRNFKCKHSLFNLIYGFWFITQLICEWCLFRFQRSWVFLLMLCFESVESTKHT